jgi:hypothetical protein
MPGKNTNHKYDIDTDRCVCGGVITYFEDGDQYGLRADGCEIGNIVFKFDDVIVSTLEQMWDGEVYLDSINIGHSALAVWLEWCENNSKELP